MPELEDDDAGQERSTRPFWSGTITFGLVSIPVSLFPATRSSRVPLRMLSPDGKPLARRYYAPATGHELNAGEMVRGYEIGKGQYVVVTDDELDRLAPEKSRDIDLRRFVHAETVPPMYFDRPYFLVPAGPSTKAYRLLAATMEATHRSGIATFVMRGKESLVAILAENGILRAETLRFSDEIRSAGDVGLAAPQKADAARVRRFKTAIDKLAADELPKDELKDEVSERLLELARKKESKHEDVVTTAAPGGKGGDVIDILTILKRSLAQAEAAKQAPAKKPATSKPAARHAPKAPKKRAK